jgi:phosphoglycerate dehydrogenase-like enzyme
VTRIAVLDDWQGVAHDCADWSALTARAEVVFFRQAMSGDELVRALQGFDVILAMRERSLLNEAVISCLPDLRLVSFTGPRNASVDSAACGRRGIVVCKTTSTRQSAATPELALGLLLACARGLARGDAEIRAGRFQEHLKPGMEMKGRTLGIVGLGRLGSVMAGYGKALGMEVLAWSTNLTDARAAEVGVARVDKQTLFSRSDAISLHLVLSDRSRGIVGAAELAAMKPGAILVNTSRGPLVAEAPLLAALQAGRITAGIDVYEIEPLPHDHPLRAAPNTVLSPHLGYVSSDTMEEFYRESIANIAAWLDGAPIRVVNADTLVARPA